MDVEAIVGVDVVLERAGGLILADEARHNLALGILSTAQAHPALYPKVEGWVVRDGDAVVGAAVRTPPYNLVLVRPTDDRALLVLADAIEGELPGVVGAIPEVDLFAGAWAAQRDVALATRFEQGVYALREVAVPDGVPGRMRLADASDRPLLLEWIDAFAKEILHEGPITDPDRHERTIDARLADGDAGFGLWELDGRPVSLAGFGGPTASGSDRSTRHPSSAATATGAR